MCTFFYKKLHSFYKKNCIGPTYKKPKPRKSAFIKNSSFEINRDPWNKDRNKDKVDKFQPIKSYILWKLMTPTITWPTDKVDEDKMEFLVPEFLEVPLQGPTCQVHLV